MLSVTYAETQTRPSSGKTSLPIYRGLAYYVVKRSSILDYYKVYIVYHTVVLFLLYTSATRVILCQQPTREGTQAGGVGEEEAGS